jgi:hypothetical protein
MYQENILTLYRFRYLKWSIALVLLCSALYIYDEPPIRPGGGTWLGYTLGTIGAVLILWLMLFGLRKRAYSSSIGSLRGWLSAHVYLGLSLAFVATLHAAFHFSWNIHTLAYILTIIVIASGFWGIALYLRQPSLMGSLLQGKTLEQCAEVLEEYDNQSKKIAANLSPEIQQMVERSVKSKIFRYPWQRYFGKQRGCRTKKLVDYLSEHSSTPEMQELYRVQVRRQLQLAQIRDYLRAKGWTEVWLMFHVPLSFALLAVLIAHTISVFFYW